MEVSVVAVTKIVHRLAEAIHVAIIHVALVVRVRAADIV